MTLCVVVFPLLAAQCHALLFYISTLSSIRYSCLCKLSESWWQIWAASCFTNPKCLILSQENCFLSVGLSLLSRVIFSSEAAVIHSEQHNVQQQLEAGFEARGGASRVTANAVLGVEEFSSALRASELTCSLAAQAGQGTPAPWSVSSAITLFQLVLLAKQHELHWGMLCWGRVLYTEARILIEIFGKQHFHKTAFSWSSTEPKQ